MVTFSACELPVMPHSYSVSSACVCVGLMEEVKEGEE